MARELFADCLTLRSSQGVDHSQSFKHDMFRDSGQASKSQRIERPPPRTAASAHALESTYESDSPGHVQMDAISAPLNSDPPVDSPFRSMSRSPFDFGISSSRYSKPSLDEIDLMVSRILAKKKAKEAEAARKRRSAGGDAFGTGLAMTADLAMKTLSAIGSFVDGRK